MKACGYDLFPVQQLEFARLKLPELKEYQQSLQQTETIGYYQTHKKPKT